MDRTGFKKFLGGLLLLLLAPTLVLVGFAAYVFWDNSRPQPGTVQTNVRPQVVWPWQEAVDLITIHGDLRPATAPPPRPVDMVFLIDVSGSMTGTLPAMREAAYRMARELAAGQPGRVHFSLIRFDTEAEITTGWTGAPEVLRAGLDRLAPFTGENDTRKAFVRLDEALQQARPGADRAAVFYTDGGLVACECPTPPMSADEIVEAASRLRRNGVGMYSVGLPGADSNPLMVQVTGSADRVFDPGSVGDLGRMFRQVANEVLGVPPNGGLITHRLDGRHFSAPLAGTAWTRGPGESLQLELGTIPAAAATYWHPLVPHSAGLWRVGIEPPRFTFLDKVTGAPVEVAAVRRPSLLVITWFTLFLAVLPALLWTLARWPRRPPSLFETFDPVVSRAPRQPLPPARLPALPAPAGGRQEVLPTVFVGLGGAGRWALQAVRADLAQGHLGDPGQPYRFLWIDLDRQEAEGPEPPFAAWEGYPVERLIAPPEVARVDSYLPEPGSVPEAWSWFDAERYRDIARENLNLTKGSRGDRPLARLALFRWLERGGVIPELARACRDVASMPSADGTWQAVVLAGRDGGVGSGFFLDFGRLLGRLGRDLQAAGKAFAPEVLGVMCDSLEQIRPENRKALALEIQTATRAGAYPTRTVYVPGDPLLDRTETETPYHWIFSVSGPDKASVSGQCSELASLLVERDPRKALLQAAEHAAAGSAHVAAVQAHSIHVLPTLVQEQVRLDLLLRILGPDVLLDVQPAPGGGYEPARPTEESAAGLLASWAAEEAPDTPLQLLLAAAAGGDLSPLEKLFKESSPPDGSWYSAVLAASVGRRLHGRRGEPASPWSRGWMPGEAVAVLRLLERHLADLTGALSDPGGRAAITEARQSAAVLADGLVRWIEGFCRACEELAVRRRHLTERPGWMQKLKGRTILELPVRPDEVESWARKCLEGWLKTPDVVSPLREHLFFAFSDGSPGGVVLRSHVAEPADFVNVSAALEALTEVCRVLARQVAASRIGGALLSLQDNRRLALARGLIDRGAQPVEVVVAAPAATLLPSAEARAVEVFRSEIPQPADHGTRREVVVEDTSAVRRLEIQEASLQEEAGDAAVVEAAEQAAERVRQRMERKHRLGVPPFPVELRVALAHPEAFRSFSRAYAAGRIVRRPDTAGREQWFFLDRSQFLTFGTEGGLAAAAAGYVWHVTKPESSFSPLEPEGDFTPLHQWVQTAGSPSDHVLCLAAIDLCRGSSGG